MKGTLVMRFIGNRQEPENDPRPSPFYRPVEPELPMPELKLPFEDGPSLLWELLHYGFAPREIK